MDHGRTNVGGFDLKTGTTLEEARTIAQFMQKHIVGLVLTL